MYILFYHPILFHTDDASSWKLTYTNAELACHAIEMYSERLRAGEQDKLKVHCYRAVLEKILVNKEILLPNIKAKPFL